MRTALAILLLASAATAGADAVVLLAPTAEVAGAVYRLGDLAEVSCADETRAASLRSLLIARTPAPGRVIRIDRRSLVGILDARGAGRVDVAGAPAVEVRVRTVTFDAGAIEEAARTFLERQLRSLPGREIVTGLGELRAVRPMVVPGGREETVLVARHTDVARTRGEVRITVRAVTDGVPMDSRVLRFRIRSVETVLVLTRDVRAGRRSGRRTFARRRSRSRTSPAASCGAPGSCVAPSRAVPSRPARRSTRGFSAGSPTCVAAIWWT
jgi:hypothetical protein